MEKGPPPGYTAMPLPAYHQHPHQQESSKDYCCCGIHVETGAKVIAILGLFGTALLFLLGFLALSPGHIVGAVFAFIIYLCIFLAQSQRTPGLYWPFLILNGFAVITNTIGLLYLIVMFFYMPNDWQRSIGKSLAAQRQDVSPRMVTGLAILFNGVGWAIALWFQMVVYGAYKFQKRQQETQQPRTYVVHQQQYP
jgi:hypothetical protein